MKIPHALMFGAIVTMGLTSLARAASAEPAEPLTLRLRLHNDAQIPPHVMIRAEKEVSRIYGWLGVTTLWVDGHSASHPVGRGRELTVIVVPHVLADCASMIDVMGIAPGSIERQGRIAFAFYDRIERFAGDYHVDVSVVLGGVMAHEIGHLLLPFGTHSATGLMRGRWNSAQVQLAVVGGLRFTPEQAELIRIELGAPAFPQKSLAVVWDP